MSGPARPDPATALSLLVLLVLAVLLFLPLLGLGRPPVWIVAALLLVRLGLQFWRARTQPGLRRPGAWLLDVVLIGLLLWVGNGQHL
ncbi:hypothetical protein MF271_03725 [Deinococcus sp. KNUC1210]|uniref:hypothetical protein n=1 Tax=Deinococcus sp. KNUC1210 TaxID=2917691 RepID=UPI001EF0BDE5|nr:hypothetical protein [Deinococcus sp. KNUC1210]ULH15758.1 hypothetical protein MF271_03725 [Deinococcus sp. KNUC1210]